MCGRVGQTKDEAYLSQRFKVDLKGVFVDVKRNIPPSSSVPVVRMDEGRRVLELQHWGIEVPWMKKGLNLAQGETVGVKQTFADSFNERPGFVVADFWFEWLPDEDGNKNPYLFRRIDGESFALAAIWKPQRLKDGTEGHCCIILTTPAAGRAKQVHPRMPVVLSEEHEKDWIDASLSPESRLQLIRALPDAELMIYPVSRLMNRPGYQDPEGFEPAGPPL